MISVTDWGAETEDLLHAISDLCAIVSTAEANRLMSRPTPQYRLA